LLVALLVDQLAKEYQDLGYVAVEGLLETSEVAAIRDEIVSIARGSRGAIIGADSGDKRSDEEFVGDILALHHPHKLSKVISDAMAHPRIVELLTAFIGPNVKAMQTMLFVKRAGKPGQAWHQDEQFIATRDRSLCGAWIALDDATIGNGCLWIHPGSHRDGVLYPMKPHSDDRFDPAGEAYGYPYDREGGVAVELKAGGVAFFNGYTLHRSLPNRAPGGFRRALVTHYMSANSLLPWTMGAKNAPEDVRDVVLVAGEDPYAWKGLRDISIPYIRPDDEQRATEIYGELQRLRLARAA
jgi:ectoine hydroxylase-related dioxygenase (phytanoyl-CoA dioxygenase family)